MSSKPRKRLLIFIAAGVGIFVCLCLAVAVFIPNSESTPEPVAKVAAVDTITSSTEKPADGPQPTETPAPTKTTKPTNTPRPTNTPAPTAKPSSTPDPNFVPAGMYLVGSDIEPGLYKGQAGDSLMDSCYWERLKDVSGSFDSILANDNAVGQFYIEITDTDFAVDLACPVVRIDYNTLEVNTSEKISAGTYLVNIDILPGLYRGEAGSEMSQSCYWERLANVRGGFDSILANDNATGQFFVQVSPNDFALKTACDLERISD